MNVETNNVSTFSAQLFKSHGFPNVKTSLYRDVSTFKILLFSLMWKQIMFPHFRPRLLNHMVFQMWKHRYIGMFPHSKYCCFR